MLWDTSAYLARFDIILLVETRCANWDSALLPAHSITFTAAASDGAAGEGIAVAVRKHSAFNVLDWGSDTDTGLWVKLQFSGSSTPLLVASCYVPPAGSRQLHALDLSSRFTSLGTQVLAACAEGSVVCAGDFNARVGTLSDGGASPRGCADACVNGHGLRLLDLCKATDMLLCTGRTPGDFHATPNFKARRHTQATRPDHVLVSADLLPHISALHVNTARQDSDHYPMELILRVDLTLGAPSVCSGQPLSCVRWRRNNRTAYVTALGGVAAPAFAACHLSALAGDPDAAFQHLDAGVREAAATSGMPTSCASAQQPRTPRVHAPFFDGACRLLKKQVRACARRGGDPSALRALERKYHSTVRAKRRAHQLTRLRALLEELRTDPRAFWRRINARRSALPVQLHTVQAWDAYLHGIANLGPPISLPTAFPDALAASFPLQPPSPTPAVAALAAPISVPEVVAGVGGCTMAVPAVCKACQLNFFVMPRSRLHPTSHPLPTSWPLPWRMC